MLKQLIQIGLTEEEAKIYLVLLEIGSSYVSAIAKRSSIQRGNCYQTLDKLKSKGLVSSFIKNKLTYFTASDPEKLVNMVKDKYDQAQLLIPSLKSIVNKLTFKPIITYFEGIEGIKNIYEDSLNSKDEILGYTNLDLVMELFPEFLEYYTKEKIKRGIKSKFISPFGKRAITYEDKYYSDDESKDLLEILFVSPKKFHFVNEINIYDNKVAIISLNNEELIGILIESHCYAQTQRAVFELSRVGATSVTTSG